MLEYSVKMTTCFTQPNNRNSALALVDKEKHGRNSFGEEDLEIMFGHFLCVFLLFVCSAVQGIELGASHMLHKAFYH